MKNLSIKAKATAGYVAVMLLTLLLTLLITGYSIVRTQNAYSIRTLRAALEETTDRVWLENGVPQLPRDVPDAYSNVRFSLIDEEGRRRQGSEPVQAGEIADGALRVLEGADGRRYWVCDALLKDGTGIRGCLEQRGPEAMGFTIPAVLNVLFVMLILSGLGGYLLTRSMLRPVARLTAKADTILRESDLSERFPVERPDHPDELGRLALTFNAMLERIEGAFRRERQFTDEISHELRTPLTVVTSACDFALSQKDPEVWKTGLETIRRKTEDMGRLTERMLQAARLDSGTETMEIERLNVSELVTDIATELVRDSGLTLDLSGVEPDVWQEGDELLFTRFAICLIDNAKKYAASRISVGLRREGESVVCSVTDDGPGFPEEAVADQRMFGRSWSAGTLQSGTGLGLYMARSIVRMHGGEIRAENAHPGARVTARVPVKAK